MKHRLKYIDNLKGAAMIMVVAGHIMLFCGLGYDNNYMDFIVMINMPLFLFLNGLLIDTLQPLTREFLVKKGRTIMIPFFAWGILITLYRHESYIDYFLNYYKFGYWYLLTLFEFCILYLFITSIACRFASDNRRNTIFVIAVVSGYLAVRFFARFIPDLPKSVLGYYWILDFYPYFFLGVFFKRFNLPVILSKNASKYMTVLLILEGLSLYGWYRYPDNAYNLLMVRFASIVLVFLIFMLFEGAYLNNRVIVLINKVLGLIGRHSLAIYMIQFFLFSSMNLAGIYRSLEDSGNTLATIGFTVFLAITICLISVVIEKIISYSKTFSFLLLGKKF